MQTTVDTNSVAFKSGYCDGILGRQHDNQAAGEPYTHTWHNYHMGFIDGRTFRAKENITFPHAA